jgi:flagellar secretion chaperone FliS
MHARAANAYRRVDLESAPKPMIVERLFARFANDVAQAREALTRRDIGTKAKAIDHAMRIVIELQASLDHSAAPELCANLAALYRYVTDRLTEANLYLTLPPLDEAGHLMAELADAFRQAHQK